MIRVTKSSQWWTGAVLIAALALGGCSKSNPDTVVGVVLKCDAVFHTSANGSPIVSFAPETGQGCSAQGAKNIRQELTVRADSKTYTAEIPADQVVHVGDPWPPK